MHESSRRRFPWRPIGVTAAALGGGVLAGCALLIGIWTFLTAIAPYPRVWREKRAHALVQKVLTGAVMPNRNGAVLLPAEDAYLAFRGTAYVTRTAEAGVCVFFPEGNIETNGLIGGWAFCTGRIPVASHTRQWSPDGYMDFICMDVVDDHWVRFRMAD